jgi:hypothetical protein
MLPHGIEVVYVDNAGQTWRLLRRLIPTHLATGVEVKQDPWHFECRFLKVLDPAHALYESFKRDLCAAVLSPCPEDIQQVKAATRSSPDAYERALRRNCRRIVRPGRVVLDHIKTIIASYRYVQCATGSPAAGGGAAGGVCTSPAAATAAVQGQPRWAGAPAAAAGGGAAAGVCT